MDDGLYESIIEKAKSIGYNTSRLELVPQKVEE
jgi:hypothetical protein